MGICELASYECLCLSKYLDSGGVPTIGIGSTVSDIKDLPLWSYDKEITMEEAVEIYKKGLVKYVAAVNRALTKLSIPQTLFDALVSICYNIGTQGMATSTFMKRVNAGESLDRIVEAMARWNKDNGVVVKGLINRRAKEARLILTDQYSSGGMVGLTPVVNKKPVYSKAVQIDLMQYL
jgi:lysozyme